MTKRKYKRASNGKFARVAGAKVVTKNAASKVRKSAVRKTKQSYVKGSALKHLDVGPSGSFRALTVGAELKSPKGRAALVRATVGYHGKPDRLVEVLPRLDKPKRLVVTVKPNPGRKKRSAPSSKASAGTRIRR